MADEDMLPGRPYRLKIGTQTVTATVQQPKYQVNVNTMEHLTATTMELNAIGVAHLSTDHPTVFDPYAQTRALGRFLLIHQTSNPTLAAGTLPHRIPPAHDVPSQNTH